MKAQVDYVIEEGGQVVAGFREPELAALAAALAMIERGPHIRLIVQIDGRPAQKQEIPVTRKLMKQAKELRRAAGSFLRSLRSRGRS